MIIELNFESLPKDQQEKARQAVAAAFANTAKAINIMAGENVAIVQKSAAVVSLDYENDMKHIKLKEQALENSIKWHLENLLKKDYKLASSLKKMLTTKAAAKS